VNLEPLGRPVKKASEVLPVLRDLVAYRGLRAPKVLRARQVLPRMLFELYVSTARAKHAEGSATRMRYL
jgi:hypothetical protein